MQILTCRKCFHAYLDMGNPKDDERLRWFQAHGERCMLPPLPRLAPEHNEAALRLLAHADTTVSH